MRDFFDFNHIDPTVDKETKKELEKFYKYYHKLWWCHKKPSNDSKILILLLILPLVALSRLEQLLEV